METKKPLPVQQINALKFIGTNWREIDASLPVEMRVSITVNGEVWVTLNCTPTFLEVLGLGFLYNEDVIQSVDEVVNIRPCNSYQNVDVWLNHAAKKPDYWTRPPGCSTGITGIRGIEQLRQFKLSMDGSIFITPDNMNIMMQKFLQLQDLYQQTGGIYASALSNGKKITYYAEDIGRHNTLDKLAGKLLYQRDWSSCQMLLTTGRISAEMLQKSARMLVPVVVSCSIPTSLSVEMAEYLGITLIFYMRNEQFIVYTHSERIRETD